jgi:hypothetical protein
MKVDLKASVQKAKEAVQIANAQTRTRKMVEALSPEDRQKLKARLLEQINQEPHVHTSECGHSREQ